MLLDKGGTGRRGAEVRGVTTTTTRPSGCSHGDRVGISSKTEGAEGLGSLVSTSQCAGECRLRVLETGHPPARAGALRPRTSEGRRTHSGQRSQRERSPSPILLPAGNRQPQ